MGKFSQSVIGEYYILDTAGHNNRKTKSLRIKYHGQVVKRIRYENTDMGQAKAVQEAESWCKQQIESQKEASAFGCAL